MIVNEINAEKILVRTKISLADYVINHYAGCQYGCLYCYARYLKRSVKRGNWGGYVDVKINAVNMLEKELQLIKPTVVMLGSITEVYQPLEKKYKLTAALLEKLAEYNIPVVILTRSNLILRDIEILKKLPKVSVFYTLTSDDSRIIQTFENNTPDYETRINTISLLREAGINVWAHIGPIIPFFTDTLKIIEDIKNIVNKIEFESLNTTTAPLDKMLENLKKIDLINANKLKELYESPVLFDEYWKTEKQKILNLTDIYKLKTHFSFPSVTEYF